jgi:hypothetical protein
MGEIFAKYSSDRELITTIYKELKKLNTITPVIPATGKVEIW